MKKILAILLAGALLFGFAACGDKGDESAVTVPSTTDEFAAFEQEFEDADNEKINGGGVVFSAAKSLIYQFMGVGADNKYTETVKKGSWESESNMHYLRKSTLTEADITNATCKESNGKYLVVLVFSYWLNSALL